MTFVLTYLIDIWENLISIIKTMGIVDCIDILLMSYLIYKLLKLVRETRAEQLLRGILIVVVILLFIRQFYSSSDGVNLRALGFLSDTFFSVGLMAVIVMFQPELRRVLEKMGRTKVMQTLTFNFDSNNIDVRAHIGATIEQIAGACEKLSRSATGAIIVVERTTKLGEQADTGVVLNAIPSVELFGNIFFPNSPMHDGAVIVRNGVVHAAGCFLPKPQKEEFISKELGTRHRAAIGMSEISDAVVIVVSEETGIISIAENGNLTRGYDRVNLIKYLTNAILKDAEETQNKKRKNRSKKQKSIAEHEQETKTT
ncbi:MAG: diadenylate cyclase CdaA [Oscillospiraceae bacterium]|nr:diadenylate cyclase CdaA [Oscillospiraceae bacterium]